MKVLKYAVATLFVVGAGAFALASCGPSGSCESDTDCSGDEVCSASGQCLVNCTESKSACTDTEMCDEVPSGKMGCFPKTGGEDTGGDDAGMSDTDGGGGGGGEAPYFVQIKDVTRSEAPEGQSVCDAGDAGDIDTAGVDIGAVELLDENGESIAWGQDDIVNNFTNVSANTNAATVLDGTSPTLAAGGEGGDCPSSDGSEPEFASSTVVSLGCKGSVVVGFQDENGEWIPIEEGYEIAVYEYDVQCFSCYPNCSDSPDLKQEAVEVKTCAPTNDASAQQDELLAASFGSDGNLSQCQNSLGTGIGAVVPFSYSP